VGSHHWNGIVECHICDLLDAAQDSLIPAMAICTKACL
jgi:hypothetical protein